MAGAAFATAGLAPLQTAVQDATRPIGDFFAGLAHLPSLQKDNEDLRQQITSDVAFTPAVKAVQERKGSRAMYARMEHRGGVRKRILPVTLRGAIPAPGTPILAGLFF